MHKQSEAEKHCNTNITVTLEEMSGLWAEINDRQRLEIIKSIIWTAHDMHGFYDKILKELDPEKFRETLD